MCKFVKFSNFFQLTCISVYKLFQFLKTFFLFFQIFSIVLNSFIALCSYFQLVSTLFQLFRLLNYLRQTGRFSYTSGANYSKSSSNITVDDASVFIPTLFQSGYGSGILSIHVHESTLEDAYFQCVGSPLLPSPEQISSGKS